MNKIKVIALCGKAGAGKDTLLHAIVDKYDVHEIISCTTRPRRENEVEGVNYYYLDKEKFLNNLVHDNMIEATEFNGWFYGTLKSSLDKDGWNIGVFNPEGISALSDNSDIDLWTFYITASDKERMLRQLNREKRPDVKEIVRRFSADEKDFCDFEEKFSHTSLRNSDEKDVDVAARIVASTCELRAKMDNPS